MTVYVDDVQHSLGRMKMCHLWADTLDELLEMVDIIGVNRKWIQGHPELSFGKHREASWVHFDIALSKKELAIRAGAILTDRYGPLVHVHSQRLADPNTDDEDRAYHQRVLDRVDRVRKKFPWEPSISKKSK